MSWSLAEETKLLPSELLGSESLGLRSLVSEQPRSRRWCGFSLRQSCDLVAISYSWLSWASSASCCAYSLRSFNCWFSRLRYSGATGWSDVVSSRSSRRFLLMAARISDGSFSYSSSRGVEGWLGGSVGWPRFRDSPEIVRELRALLKAM